MAFHCLNVVYPSFLLRVVGLRLRKSVAAASLVYIFCACGCTFLGAYLVGPHGVTEWAHVQ